MKSIFARPVSKLALMVLAFVVVLSAAGCGGSAAVPAESSAVPAESSAIPAEMPALPSGAGNVMPGGSGSFSSVAPTHSDLAYASVSETQKLDLYIPEGTGPFPVVIMVHGGGFMFGDKADGMGLTGVDQLLAAGYAVASINYRLSGEAQYPAQIFDAKAAVRFLRANAETYNLNSEKFGA